MPYDTWRYVQMHEHYTLSGQALFQKAALYRRQGKPLPWARDIERKGLRHFEKSFMLRHYVDLEDYLPRPAVFPAPPGYSKSYRW